MKVSMRVRVEASETAPFTETPPTPTAAAPVVALETSWLSSLTAPATSTCASPTMEASVLPPTMTSATDAPTAAAPPPTESVAASSLG